MLFAVQTYVCSVIKCQPALSLLLLLPFLRVFCNSFGSYNAIIAGMSERCVFFCAITITFKKCRNLPFISEKSETAILGDIKIFHNCTERIN